MRNKNVYELNLHEQTECNDPSGYIVWTVTRVPGGWIYSYVRLDSGQMNSVFVPFDNDFQKKEQHLHEPKE